MQGCLITPLFLAFLSRCLRIRQCGCSLVFLACSSCVVSRSYFIPPDPIKVFVRLRPPKFLALFALTYSLFVGVCRYLCYARLLYRSGCGSVTVFESTVHSTSMSLPFGTQADTFGALIFSRIHSHHTARLMSSHKLCTSALLLPFASSPL